MNIVQQLECFLNQEFDPELFPVKKGNKLFFGNFSITESKKSFLVKDKKGTVIGRTKTKLAAAALLKECKRVKSNLNEIYRLDKMYARELQNCIFYKHAYDSTDDYVYRQSLELKSCDASEKIQDIKHKLSLLVFPKKINIKSALQGKQQ